MNPLDQLSSYLRRIERNLRMLTLARGLAVLCAAALLVTVALVLLMNQLSFSGSSVFYSRIVLFFVLAISLTAALAVPLLWLNSWRAARTAERRYPQFGERLLTFVERRSSRDPFLPLLAADALPYATPASLNQIAAPSQAWMFGGIAALSAVALLWLGTGGPGYIRYGTSLLWGISKTSSQPFYSVTLDPGDARVRRHSDQIIAAHLNGFFSRQASLFVRYASATKWEETAMKPQSDGASFQFLLVGIPENVDYYVVSNGIRSGTSRLTAVDLPQVTHLGVTYHFPRAYGRKDETEDPGGDLRAIQGTVGNLSITSDKPLKDGVVLLDDGTKIPLEGSGTSFTAAVPIQKDGAYHIAVPDSGQLVRLTDDYFIEARPDSPPVVTILKPVRDARATPIEEVPVDVQARDDNGVLALDLHYSVNGGPEQVRSLTGAKGAKETRGSSLLSLEDFKLVPGDVVSVYATARDALTTSRSDIYFIEARPFELNYTQSQAAGGGGGGGMEQPKIAERQKEIIAATFNQLKNDKKDPGSDAENAKYLAGVQAKLRDEAQSLSNRMKARSLEGGSAAIAQFVTDMEAAIGVMGPASDQLKDRHWNDALSPEQKALQYLLRAEAIFRDIQVSFGNQGGGGGQSGGATRDLEGLTSLELDTQKNQYESGSQSAQDARQKEIDNAMRKLEELAKRQQQLAQQAQSKQNFQQRWEQEMLRREAEQVRKQLEQLSRNNQQGQQSQQGQQGQQGSQGSQGQQGSQQGQQGSQQQQQSQQAQNSSGGRLAQGSKQAMEDALQRLSEATKQMSDAASHNSQSEAEKAADQLSRAQSALSQMRKQETGNAMSDAIDQSRKLAEKQSNFDSRLRHNFGAGASGERSEEQNRQLSSEMAQEKKREIDDLHQLEHAMQQTARNLQDTQPDAAKKLRDAIGELQQNELESRMRWTADALDKGIGSYAVMREAPVTMGLNQLKDRLQEADGAMTKGGAGKPGQDQGIQEALQRAQKLSQDLKQMAQSAPGRQQGQGQQPGQGKGQGQPGQGQQGQGQQGQGQQQGQGEGQQSSSGQPGQVGGPRSGFAPQGGFGPAGPEAGGSWSAMNFGGGPAPDQATTQREYEETVRQLNRMQQSVRSDPATAKDIQQLLNEVGRLDPRRFNADPARLAQLEQKLFAEVEQAELILRRKLDESNGSIRTSAPQDVPPGYSDAVAEYFRRLSR